jgi:hypothetical protein
MISLEYIYIYIYIYIICEFEEEEEETKEKKEKRTLGQKPGRFILTSLFLSFLCIGQVGPTWYLSLDSFFSLRVACQPSRCSHACRSFSPRLLASLRPRPVLPASAPLRSASPTSDPFPLSRGRFFLRPM